MHLAKAARSVPSVATSIIPGLSAPAPLVDAALTRPLTSTSTTTMPSAPRGQPVDVRWRRPVQKAAAQHRPSATAARFLRCQALAWVRTSRSPLPRCTLKYNLENFATTLDNWQGHMTQIMPHVDGVQPRAPACRFQHRQAAPRSREALRGGVQTRWHPARAPCSHGSMASTRVGAARMVKEWRARRDFRGRH